MTRRINAGEGSLGKLLNDDALAKSLTQTAGNFEQITGQINRGQGTAGKLLNETAMYDRLNAHHRADGQAGGVDSRRARGPPGMLLQDKQLYDNMNGAANELRSLIADIRKDPKKFLNVRVSIF